MSPEQIADGLLADAIRIGQVLNQIHDRQEAEEQLRRIEARRAERMTIAFGPLSG